MGNYRNFELVVYFIAHGVKNADEAKLEEQIAFFKKYMRPDKVYIEPYRDGCFASEEQVRLVKNVFERNGIRTQGGITTSMPDPEGQEKKQRMFNTLCYNDEGMMSVLQQVCELNARVFDGFIIDDFFFSNCTCDKCRSGRDEFNRHNGITDGSWQAYRTDLLYRASQKYIIDPAKSIAPECEITIKYPNWMESYQETGYDPASQKEIFDLIYTGTETRDPVNTDQHLPRYLSYSLMGYMDRMAPDRNGGGWFDPYDCRMLDYYLEQAYLTAFAKPKEMMLFCFQSLCDSVNVPALGFMLDKLDSFIGELGRPVGIPCYIPNASQGEDNVQDFLGMNGFPIIPTPEFEENAPTMLLTASSAYDRDIIDKLERYAAAGGKAIITSGFVKATLGRGLERLTSIRDRDRTMTVQQFAAECSFFHGRWERESAAKAVSVPVLEFRNNATWGAVCKAICEEEACTLFARDTYGKGQIYTLVLPEAFSEIKYYPQTVLTRMRKEFSVNGVRLDAHPQISLFTYDNDTFVI
ncbi:MAG: permease, partial [Ruminococcaceae bacterium]|nr:permease [Oscillospiraceae bacterium]